MTPALLMRISHLSYRFLKFPANYLTRSKSAKSNRINTISLFFLLIYLMSFIAFSVCSLFLQAIMTEAPNLYNF
jgi:hypothetical protein